MRRVVTAPEAAAALRLARAWLMQPGAGSAGRARWDALRSARLRFCMHPYLGSASAELPGRRQLVIADYKLIYRVDPDTGDSVTAGDVRILAVFGPGQK